jgi:hypothetical protein
MSGLATAGRTAGHGTAIDVPNSERDKAKKSFTAYFMPHNARLTATRVAPTM